MTANWTNLLFVLPPFSVFHPAMFTHDVLIYFGVYVVLEKEKK
jgi:hypothetical protein